MTPNIGTEECVIHVPHRGRRPGTTRRHKQRPQPTDFGETPAGDLTRMEILTRAARYVRFDGVRLCEPRCVAMKGERWFRDVYRDAVWEDETLTATEKAVAETYARHAKDCVGNKTADADLAWLTYERVMAKAGIRRRANVADATKALVKGGWLVPHIEKPRAPTVYRLAVPLLASSDGGTSGASGTSSDGGTRLVPKTPSTSSALSGSSTSASSDGGTPPSEDLPQEKKPSSSSARAGLEALRVRLPIASDDEGVWILAKIRSRAAGPIRKSMAAYLTGVLDEHLLEYQLEYRDLPGQLPDHCGRCDRLRMIPYPDGRVGPCPTCHRLRESARPAYEAAVAGVAGRVERPVAAVRPTMTRTRRKPSNICGNHACDGVNITVGINKIPCKICANARNSPD